MRRVNHRTTEQIKNGLTASIAELTQVTGHSEPTLHRRANEGCFDIVGGKAEVAVVMESWRNGWSKLGSQPVDAA